MSGLIPTFDSDSNILIIKFLIMCKLKVIYLKESHKEALFCFEFIIICLVALVDQDESISAFSIIETQ